MITHTHINSYNFIINYNEIVSSLEGNRFSAAHGDKKHMTHWDEPHSDDVEAKMVSAISTKTSAAVII